MIQLIFTACLSAVPAQCADHAITYVDLSHRACMNGAMPELAQWAGTHPGYVIRRWHCDTSDPTRRDI